MITQSRVLKALTERMKDGSFEAMNVNVNIKDVQFKAGKILVDYAYEIAYAPGVARMEIAGQLVADEKNAKEIEDQFKKNKQLPPAFTEEMLTAITYTATTVGTLLAFSIGISAPLNIPRARLAPPQQASKAG